MTWLKFWFITFIYVALKAWQQQNAQGGNYWMVPPVSYGMAICEVLIVLWVVRTNDLWAMIPIGTGGWMGSITAMYLYRKYVKNGNG